MNKEEKIGFLINIILDKQGAEAERQDALFYLRDYNSVNIEKALVKIINDETDDYDMRRDACETLAEVWNNQNKCNPDILKDMDRFLAQDVKMFTLAFRPEWASYFEGNEPE